MDPIENLRDFKYILLPGKCPPEFKNIGLYNKAYIYWREFWNKFFEDNGMAGKLSKDDFFRQDKIAIIMYQDQIVAMHLYTFFNIQTLAATEHSYFQRSFSSEFIEKIKNRGTKSAMSFEWLTVDSQWRKTKTHFSFALVNIALGGHIQEEMNIDAGVAVSRNDVKVTQAGIDFGWDVIVPQVQMHGFPCDLLALFKGNLKDHPIKEVQIVSRYLWENRMDLTQGLEEPVRHLKVA